MAGQKHTGWARASLAAHASPGQACCYPTTVPTQYSATIIPPSLRSRGQTASHRPPGSGEQVVTHHLPIADPTAGDPCTIYEHPVLPVPQRVNSGVPLSAPGSPPDRPPPVTRA